MTKFFLAICLVLMSASAQAENYHPVEFSELTSYFVTKYNELNLKDLETFTEFAKVENCDVYQQFSDNEFEWSKIQQAFLNSGMTSPETLSLQVPVTLKISRYNMDTQAFDIPEKFALKNVGLLTLTDPKGLSFCGGVVQSNQFERIPRSYEILLDIPISLYRIPMAEKTAQFFLDKLSRDNQGMRQLYATISFKATGLNDEMKDKGREGYIGILKGHIDKIDFFVDRDRQQKIKTLRYDTL